MSYVYRYFLSYSWSFRDDNVQAMIETMSDVDRAIFNCDLTTISFLDFIKTWTIGLKKYIIKDELKDSVPALKRQNVLCVVNYVLLALYFYAIWSIFYLFLSTIKYMLFWIVKCVLFIVAVCRFHLNFARPVCQQTFSTLFPQTTLSVKLISDAII